MSAAFVVVVFMLCNTVISIIKILGLARKDDPLSQSKKKCVKFDFSCICSIKKAPVRGLSFIVVEASISFLLNF